MFPEPDNCMQLGMTLRQWYAGLAMQGMFSNSRLNIDKSCAHVSKLCFAQADALIAEEAEDENA